MASIEITFDNDGLSKIYAAGQSVTLTRTVGQLVQSMARTSAAAASLAVAWQAFSPLANNTVSWTDDYYCLATTTPLVLGNVIAINSQSSVPMVTGSIYTFSHGQFSQTPSSGSSYVVGNATPGGSYDFGLAQNATINNTLFLGPLCAVPVLYNQAAYFNPTDQISIFLSSATAPGTVLPPLGNPFSIVVSGSGSPPVIGFNDQINTFYQIS